MPVSLFVAVLGFAISTTGLRAEPAAPKGPPPEKRISVPTTPERVIADIEGAVKRRKDQGARPSPRGYNFRAGLPDNAAEFAKLSGYSVMLLTVISQKTEELPVKRVYIQSGTTQIDVQRLSSWRSEVDSKHLAHEMYGHYREDGFYLLPVGPMTRDGTLVVDLTADKVSFSILKLPSPSVTQRSFAQPDPSPGAKPDARALRELIQRKFTGFPVPKYP